MLHTANPVIKHKAGLLNLAEELSLKSEKAYGLKRYAITGGCAYGS